MNTCKTETAPGLVLRGSGERGYFDHGWLETYHTFSFGAYRDPAHDGFRTLRVLNEDLVQPGKGFRTHPHREMEIVTFVVDGSLEHRDSMGNGSIIGQGDVQRMSAGTGITHSEFNPSPLRPVHIFQLWILPEREGIEPGYEQKHFDTNGRRGRLRPIVSRDGREGSLTIHQDAAIFDSLLLPGESVTHDVRPGRGVWIQVVRGAMTVNGLSLSAGDGIRTEEPGTLEVVGREETAFLLFDLA